MTLPDVESLEKLIKMLRSNGVLQYNSTDLSLVLAEKPQDISQAYKSLAEETMEAELSPEEELERLVGHSDIPVHQPGFFKDEQ